MLQWRNSAFHHHGVVEKRKMLGGVSFDGGIVGSQNKGVDTGQADVQTAQPSFPHVPFETISSHGIGTESGGFMKGLDGKEKTSEKLEIGKRDREADKISNKDVAEEIDDTKVMAGIGMTVPQQGQNTYRAIIRQYAKKIQSGIQTLLKGMKQKEKKDSRQKPSKQNRTGTRAITKEEVYEMQMDMSYLLDSYNKHGQRSTLGK